MVPQFTRRGLEARKPYFTLSMCVRITVRVKGENKVQEYEHTHTHTHISSDT